MATNVVASMRSRPARWRSLEKERQVADNGDSAFMTDFPHALQGLNETDGWLFAVADGLGGEGNDDVASQTAIGALERLFVGTEKLDDTSFDTPDGWLRAVYSRANLALCDVREKRHLRGVFTTLTSALLVPGIGSGLRFYPANIGDSRMYLLRKKKLLCVTRDDGEGGMVSRVIGDPNVFSEPYLRYATTVGRTPAITEKVLRAIERVLKKSLDDINASNARSLAALFLTLLEGAYPIELATSYSRPLAILLDGLGPDKFSALVGAVARGYIRAASKLAPIELKPDDRLFLCSDGISNAFSESFLRDAIELGTSGTCIKEELDSILTFLLEAPGWVDDDRTAVIVHVESV